MSAKPRSWRKSHSLHALRLRVKIIAAVPAEINKQEKGQHKNKHLKYLTSGEFNSVARLS